MKDWICNTCGRPAEVAQRDIVRDYEKELSEAPYGIYTHWKYKDDLIHLYCTHHDPQNNPELDCLCINDALGG